MGSANQSPFENLGAIDTAFENWSLFRGELYTPEGIHYRPGDIQAIAAERAQIRALEDTLRSARPETVARRVAELRRQAVAIETAAAALRASIRL